MSTIDVSVIIVNWKVRELLRGCIASLFATTQLPRDRYEVIVVDNDSRDGSVEMVRREFPDVQLIASERNLGFGAGNNLALKISSGRTLLLLNPDTLVTEDVVTSLLQTLDTHPDVSIAGCRLLNRDGSLQKWTGGAFPTLHNVANHYLFLDRLLPRSLRPRPLYLVEDLREDTDVDWVSGACLILRRDCVDTWIFDPAFFMYGEDMELCHRVKARGMRVLYCPGVSVIHFQGESMKKQQGDILLSSLKGPRQFFQLTRGSMHVWALDWLTVLGFGLRTVLYGAAGAATRNAGFAAKARSSAGYLRLAYRLMRRPAT